MVAEIMFTRKTKFALVLCGFFLCTYLVLMRLVTFPKVKDKQRSTRSVWTDKCPVWWPGLNASQASSSSSLMFEGRQSPSPETVEMLAKMLRERLDLVHDVVTPDYSKPCDESSSDLKACTSQKCADRIHPQLAGRVRDVLTSPELQLSNEHREAIAAFSRMFPESDTIIVSATSSNHFGETQKMFQSLHEVAYPVLKNFTAVLVDIGLTERERRLAERGCRCHVVRFPRHLFPAHVGINNCYSFKPLAVLAAMHRARRLVVWQDSSVRWTRPGLEHIIARAEQFGSQIIRYEGAARVTAHTLRPSFDYMKREVCGFTTFPEIEACAQVHRNDPVTLRLILEPWARCGLERCCICPVEPWPVLPCTSKTALHRCHRFDQSALTMVLGRLLDRDFQKFVMPNELEAKPILYKLGGDELSNYF